MTTFTGVISYPVPLYANVPIDPDAFIPSQYVISAITLGNPTTITTAINHNYVVGQQVRLLIPPSFGSIQLNQQIGYVLAISNPNQVQVSINSNNANAFIASPSTIQSAQIVAIGDINEGQTNTNGLSNQNLFIPGSFQNISPN